MKENAAAGVALDIAVVAPLLKTARLSRLGRLGKGSTIVDSEVAALERIKLNGVKNQTLNQRINARGEARVATKAKSGKQQTDRSKVRVVDDLANGILKNARAAEADVTSALQNLSSKVGGRMEGLNFKLKSQDSLIRKIAIDAELQNVSLNIAAKNINDALRYTTILDSKGFGKNALKIMSELEASGYTKIAVKNSFKKDAIYKGVNTTFKTKSGQVFELQFHTKSSFNVKQNINHSLYEEARLKITTTVRQQELIKLMRKNSESISTVQGANLIKNFRH